MSGQCESTRQSDCILPMMVDASGNPNGISVACSTSVVGVDLTTVPGFPGTYDAAHTVADNNPIGHYVDIEADGGDVYVLFGPSLASVTGANAPAPAFTNTIASGVVTMAKGACVHVPSGTTKSFKLPRGAVGGPNAPQGQGSPCRFVGLITASGTAKARIWLCRD